MTERQTPARASIGDRVRVHDVLFPFALQTATILDRTVGAGGATALGVIDRSRTLRTVSPARLHALDAPEDLPGCAWCAHRRALVLTHERRPEGTGARPDGHAAASADIERPRWMDPPKRVPARSR